MAVFLNVSKAFDKIWYDCLLYKIKNNFPSDFHIVIIFWILHRIFIIKYGKALTQLKVINSKVLQDSILDILPAIHRRCPNHSKCNNCHLCG